MFFELSRAGEVESGTLRHWVHRHEREAGLEDGMTSEVRAEKVLSSAQTNPALTFKPDHQSGADHRQWQVLTRGANM